MMLLRFFSEISGQMMNESGNKNILLKKKIGNLNIEYLIYQ